MGIELQNVALVCQSDYVAMRDGVRLAVSTLAP